MVHQEKPQQMLRLFCCAIPFGTDSHFAQALVFVSRGLSAKNAPQEHFLDAPTDGAPRKAATDVAAFLLHHSLQDGFMLRLRLAFSSRGLGAKNGCGFVSRGHV